MGVWVLRCTANGKVLIGSSPNLPAAFNQIRFRLKMQSHPNHALLADLRQFGPDAFTLEVLDELAPPENDDRPRALVEADVRGDLAALEAMWTAELQPWGERGYASVPRAARPSK